MDLAPSVGVFTQPVTTSINLFSAVNATKTRILKKVHTEMVTENLSFRCVTLGGWKKVSLSSSSHLSIFLFPPFLSLIPRAIPPGSCPPISLDPFE